MVTLILDEKITEFIKTHGNLLTNFGNQVKIELKGVYTSTDNPLVWKYNRQEDLYVDQLISEIVQLKNKIKDLESIIENKTSY